MKRRAAAYVVFLLLVAVIWNLPVSYRIGVDGEIFNKTIPLYAKACGFLYRDRMYKDIVREIVRGEKDETKKTLSIFRWVVDNVHSGIPDGLKLVDDHPLNIIIRQYGSGGQLEDIFTILCGYAGMKAGMKKCYNNAHSSYIVLSFVRVNSRWLIFDVSGNKYFFNRSGEIGSVEDYYGGELVMSDAQRAKYSEFLDDSKGIGLKSFLRVEEQMPFKRTQAGIKRLFIKKDVGDDVHR